MRVVQMWKGTSDRAGGGGLLMGQLHRRLRRDGVDSRILAEERAAASFGGVVGEDDRAAWAALGHVLLNTKEFLFLR